MRPRDWTGHSGFTTAELLTALLLTLVIVGAAAGLADPSTLAARVQPDRVDAQQRLRTAVDVLTRDLYVAGSGIDAGALAGPLGRYFPPVIPRRIGRSHADPTTTARPDAITLLSVPPTSAQTALSAGLIMPTAQLHAMAGCPLGRPACGLTVSDGLVVFDSEGHFDLFTVLSTMGTGVDLQQRGQTGPHAFAAGSHAAQVEVRGYYFDASQQQLRVSDGDATDQPVVDGIAHVGIEYYGSPLPPRWPKPPPGVANCLYDGAGVPNPVLITLPAGADGLAVLPLTLLNDGPWCGAGDTRFDADLLRVRRVRIAITAAAGHPRSGRHPSVTFDVAPRNLADQP